MEDKAKNDQTIVMYAHPGCPQMPTTLGLLKSANVDFEYINIHNNLEARHLVQEINNGYESVPTLVFPDGSTLTEPSAGELKDKLQTMGYSVPFTSLLIGNAWRILTVVIIIYAALRFLEIL